MGILKDNKNVGRCLKVGGGAQIREINTALLKLLCEEKLLRPKKLFQIGHLLK